MVVGLLLAALASCGGGSPGATVPDPEFQVTQVTPFDDSEDVPLTAEIDVIFSREVDPDTLDPDSLMVIAESGDKIVGDRLVAPLNRGVVRFLPRQGLFPFAVHTIRVTQAVKDVDGIPLDKVYEFQFQTEEAGPVLPGPGDVEDLGRLLMRGRWSHRMTLLENNRFIVIGGYGADNQTLAQAESLVVPLKESFLIPATLRVPRAAHVQVELADGRILIAGGETSSDPFVPLASCEIFDPSDFSFHAAATMNRARSFAHGTRLTDGRVLVTGGQGVDPTGGFVFLDDAEIYDPADDSWTTVPGVMRNARTGHYSIGLAGGDAVVVGGTSGLASADRWLAATGLFASSFNGPSFAHYFGSGTPLSGGRLLVASGVNSTGVTIYDPAFGFLGAVNRMADQRAFATATAFPDGRVVIAGGIDVAALPVLVHDTFDIFFPIGQTGKMFRVDVRLPVPTSHHAAALGSDGAVWITGGIPLDLGEPGLRQVTVIHPGDD